MVLALNGDNRLTTGLMTSVFGGANRKNWHVQGLLAGAKTVCTVLDWPEKRRTADRRQVIAL